MNKETKWSYEKVEKAARIVGRGRDCVRRSLAKVLLPLEEINFGITVSLCFWLFRGEVCGLVNMWPRGETRVRCRSGIRHRIDRANFGVS